MAKIHSIKIENFRGIKEFNQVFGSDFICLIGRGDSGKSTILEAISLVLSPYWNEYFCDSDFYNCNPDNSIVIEATLYDVPSKLLEEGKYGLYIKGLSEGKIHDEIDDNHDSALTIRLTVDKDLEPHWEVVGSNEEVKPISANDRASFNVFIVSDYVDRHFSWDRGNPLHSLLKQDSDDKKDGDGIIIDSLRRAKKTIDGHGFPELHNTLARVQINAKALGLDASSTSNTIDFKDLHIKDGKLSIHDSNIPFRLKGKGSKRLLSVAIQSSLVQDGGIILVDEIEHGLEPDRAQHLAYTLKSKNPGQVFISTHSRDVLVELEHSDLYLARHNEKGLLRFSDSIQGLLRSNPEAFFSKKIVLCEGATEKGVCRALDRIQMKKTSMSAALLGVRYVNGRGNTFWKYAEQFNNTQYPIVVFCDSDVETMRKDELIRNGIGLIDWEKGDCIETAIVKYLPEKLFGILISSAVVIQQLNLSITREEALKRIRQSITVKLGEECPLAFTEETLTDKVKKAIGEAAKTGEWFKQESASCVLWERLFEKWNEIPDNLLKQNIDKISEFVYGVKL